MTPDFPGKGKFCFASVPNAFQNNQDLEKLIPVVSSLVMATHLAQKSPKRGPEDLVGSGYRRNFNPYSLGHYVADADNPFEAVDVSSSRGAQLPFVGAYMCRPPTRGADNRRSGSPIGHASPGTGKGAPWQPGPAILRFHRRHEVGFLRVSISARRDGPASPNRVAHIPIQATKTYSALTHTDDDFIKVTIVVVVDTGAATMRGSEFVMLPILKAFEIKNKTIFIFAADMAHATAVSDAVGAVRWGVVLVVSKATATLVRIEVVRQLGGDPVNDGEEEA